MNKFIIIDHSIKDNSGHYLEYASRILYYSKELGFEPILLTNKLFKNYVPDNITVYPVYTKTFFENNFSKSSSIFVRICMQAKLFFNSFFGHSINGVIIIILKIILKKPVTKIFLTINRVLKEIYSLLRIKSIFLVLIASYEFLLEKAKHLANKDGGEDKDKNKYKNKIFRKTFTTAKKKFSKETFRILRKLNVSSKDVILIPTVEICELLGIADLIKNQPDFKKMNFHFIFRREFFDYTHSSDILAIRRIYNFYFSRVKFYCDNMHFYSDTKQLCELYNGLGFFNFDLLPIPIPIEPQKKVVKSNSPISFTYLGDARDEKGFQKLPYIVAELWKNYISNGKIRIFFQANFNCPKGEFNSASARLNLLRYPSDKVKLFLNSMSNNEYNNLLNNADIIIIPYESNNYKYRSSGILVEALSRLKTVLVPSGTWMAAELSQLHNTYHKYLLEKYEIGEKLNLLKYKWTTLSNNSVPQENNNILHYSSQMISTIFYKEKDASELVLFIEGLSIENPNILLIEIAEKNDDDESLNSKNIQIHLPKNTDNSVKLSISPDTSYFWIGIKTLSDNKSEISKIKVSFLKTNKDIPSDVNIGGEIYYDDDDMLNKATSLIENYQYYEDNAKQFLSDWSVFHTMDNFMKKILIDR